LRSTSGRCAVLSPSRIPLKRLRQFNSARRFALVGHIEIIGASKGRARLNEEGVDMEQGLNRNVGEALALFADELSALRYLERILWPNGVCCPHCGELGKVGKLNGAWWNLSPADNGEDIAFATTLAFAAAEAIARPFQALYDPHSSAGDPRGP
jgi:hypothetical protein